MPNLWISLACWRRTLGILWLTFATLTQAQEAPASITAAAPEEEPSTQVLSDTLHHDDVKNKSTFTGDVTLTRGQMTLTADTLEVWQDAKGDQFGVAIASKGKIVTIRQKRPENFELIEGNGLRAEYDSQKAQVDLIGQAVVTRYICGKAYDTIRGERVRYYEKTGTYDALGGPNSAAVGGRVRSVIEPREKIAAAIAACRKAGGVPSYPAAGH